MKKRKGWNRRKTRAYHKGWSKMDKQIEAAAKRRKPGDKPSKGMRRFGIGK